MYYNLNKSVLVANSANTFFSINSNYSIAFLNLTLEGLKKMTRRFKCVAYTKLHNFVDSY